MARRTPGISTHPAGALDDEALHMTQHLLEREDAWGAPRSRSLRGEVV